MAPFSIGPSYVRIYYSSVRGTHVMTRPTRPWAGVPWATDSGSYEGWDGTSNPSASDMIEALIDAMLPLYTDDITFDSYLIFNAPAPGEEPVPVYAGLLTGKVGGVTADVSYLAFQKTYTFITAQARVAKLVLLDVPTGGNISRAGSVTGAELALVNVMLNPIYAWAGRDDEQIVAFRSLNNSVNKALERRYGL